MKVRELLMKMEGVCSYGFYTRSGNTLNAHPDVHEIMEYLDEDISRFTVWIYDDKDTDIYGKEFDIKRIRCCIYLDRDNEDGMAASIANPLSKGLFDDIQCPYCGAKHFRLGATMTAAIHIPTVIKDGKVVPHGNAPRTTQCTCLECDKNFTIDENNEVHKIPGQEDEHKALIDYVNLESGAFAGVKIAESK